MKRIVILTAGWLCLGLGVMGLFLPFLQGLLLVGCGLLLLSKESEVMKRVSDRLKERYPRQYERILVWENRLISLFKK
ncbi:MAG: PGPGW domain-containing protein [Thermodesulfobacteriota bacterium]